MKYTTSVGPVQGDLKAPDPTWAPKLSEYRPGAAPLDPPGRYVSPNGGYAVITETTYQSQVPGPNSAQLTVNHTVRTVQYFDYVNEDGLILRGSESTDSTASPTPLDLNA